MLNQHPHRLYVRFLTCWATKGTSHILFAHFSLDGHLGCFHLLAIVHNAAWPWVHKQLFMLLPLFLLGVYPGVKWLDLIMLLLIFGGNYLFFSILTSLFYIPANNAQGFQFLHINVNPYSFPSSSSPFLLYSNHPKAYLFMVWICFFLVIMYVEYPFLF